MTETNVYSVAARAIARADALLILAGAGMGVDSGLPDFRGDAGFWRAYPPSRELGLSFVDLAQPAWFRRDPELAWGFYGHRLNLYRTTTPHAGFALLSRWAAGKPEGGQVFTSNVDGQFQQAGFATDRVFECHGSIHHLQCSRPCTGAIWGATEIEVDVNTTTFRARPPLPQCPFCGAVARPNILMFGDGQWLDGRAAEQEIQLSEWLAGLRDANLTIIECGAGTAIATVRATAEHLTRRYHATLIRINPREPEGPHGTLSLAAGALDALTAINRVLEIDS
jgi:NAD-dependent SIR2 family protein deacetylase